MRKKQTEQRQKSEEAQEHAVFTLRSIAGRQNCNYIPEKGEPVYDLDSQELLIGDGETPMSLLRSIDNVVAASDGRLYTVSINSKGQVTQVLPFHQLVNCGAERFVMELRVPVPMPPLFLN